MTVLWFYRHIHAVHHYHSTLCYDNNSFTRLYAALTWQNPIQQQNTAVCLTRLQSRCGDMCFRTFTTTTTNTKYSTIATTPAATTVITKSLSNIQMWQNLLHRKNNISEFRQTDNLRGSRKCWNTVLLASSTSPKDHMCIMYSY